MALQQFQQMLKKLDGTNCHRLIGRLTVLASKQTKYAIVIIDQIEKRMNEVETGLMPFIQLLDNIVQELPDFKIPIQLVIADLLVRTVELSDKKERRALKKIRNTWGSIFSEVTLHEIDTKINAMDDAWQVADRTEDEIKILMEMIQQEQRELAARQEVIDHKIAESEKRGKVGHRGEPVMQIEEDSPVRGQKRKQEQMSVNTFEEIATTSRKRHTVEDRKENIALPNLSVPPPPLPIPSRFLDAWQSTDGKVTACNPSPFAAVSKAKLEAASSSGLVNQLWEQMGKRGALSSSAGSVSCNVIPGLDDEGQADGQPHEAVGLDQTQTVDEEISGEDSPSEREKATEEDIVCITLDDNEDTMGVKSPEVIDMDDEDEEEESFIETNKSDKEKAEDEEEEKAAPADQSTTEVLLGEETSLPTKPLFPRKASGIKMSLKTKILPEPKVITIDEEEEEITTPEYDKEAVFVPRTKTKEEREAAKPRLVGRRLTTQALRVIDQQPTGLCCIM